MTDVNYIFPLTTIIFPVFVHREFKGKNIELNTYDLESIAGDKICRILDVDKEPRDIYDPCYLLKLNINITKIKGELKKRFGFNFYGEG